jgi:hypothetical protein
MADATFLPTERACELAKPNDAVGGSSSSCSRGRDDLGESGRIRLDNDRYPTPALSSAALMLGLEKMGLMLPAVALDPCGGAGQLARVAMALAPGVEIWLSDIRPQLEAADLYATFASADATIPADLQSMLRVTGARAILSNPPFKRSLYARIFRNCLDLLRRGDIDFFALMQRAQRSVDCEIGGDETAFEPLFAGMIACPWRSWLWPQQPGQASPKGAYSWLVYAAPPRGHDHHRVYTIARTEAETALGRLMLARPCSPQDGRGP